VRQLSNQHIVHPGLEIWKKAGYGRKAINVEDIPGVKEAGWQPDPHSQWRVRLVNAAGDRPPSKSLLHVFMRSVLRVG
jgi:histone acetyltransferase